MLLVVTATAREAAPLHAGLADAQRSRRHHLDTVDGHAAGVAVRLATTGIGRASAAFTLGRLLLDDVQAVLQVGVGGSFDLDRAAVTDVALATGDTYADLGARTDAGWVTAEQIGLPLVERAGNRWFDSFPCDPHATDAAATRLGVPAAPFATVETVTGTAAAAAELAARTGALIESMEGAAAAHACLLADVPFVQLRAVSNAVGPRDRAAWRLDDAIEAAAEAALAALPTIDAATSPDAT